MSPELLSYAMSEYLNVLRHQVDVAKAFYFGRLSQGMDGLLTLPEEVRIRIDQLIWEAAGGQPLDPTEKESQSLIAAAIMRSVEERMGMHEN